jgi:hypothetical protein
MRATDHFEGLCALLEAIDESHAGQSGSLTFGGPSQGIVLVQSGRICWAASSMVPTRLTDRLVHASAAGELELRRTFHECRQSGRPFGQTLVERGIVTAEVLRTALLQHNAETLLELAGHPAPQWQPARVEHYDPRLTFSSSELLAHSADAWWGPLAARARDELHAAIRGSDAQGLAFLRVPEGDDSIVPVGMVGMDHLTARETLAIGRTAVGVMRSCRAIAGHLVATTSMEGRTTLVWVDDGAFYLAIGHERSEMAFVLAHLSRRSVD